MYPPYSLLDFVPSYYYTERRKYVGNPTREVYMEAYFDLLFALNERTHPGEKRLIQLCLENCPLLPKNFEGNLNVLFSHLFTEPELIVQDLDRILAELYKIL